MSLYTFHLKAGQDFHRVVFGRLILVDSTGEAERITIKAMRGSQEIAVMPDRQKAFKCWIDYDNIILRAEVDCVVRLFLSTADVSLGFADGANVNVRGGVTIENDPDNRVPVDIGGGTVTVTADNVGISNDDDSPVPVRKQALGTLQHSAPRAVGTVPVMVSAEPTLRRLCLKNASDVLRIALGGPDVTYANAAIVLEPGDMWVEEDAAGAAWYAVAEGAGAELRMMGAK